MLKRFSVVLLISALALLLIAVTVSAKSIDSDPPVNSNPPAPVIGPNLLTNPGLEGHYNQQCSRMGQAPWIAVPCDPKHYDPSQLNLWATAQVPSGWSAWWRVPDNNFSDPNYFNNYPAYCNFDQGRTPPDCVPWHNPEFRDTAGGPQDTGPARRIEGDNSQKYFTFYTIHEAGLYQMVDGVKPGQRLRFAIYMEAWSSPYNDPNHSVGQPTMGMKVGIDPYGGNNPWSSNIIWSPVQESFDHFSLFSVEAVAKNSVVSVWTRSQPFFAIQHNDVYVDAASLNVIGSTGTVTRPLSTTRPRPKLTPVQVPAICKYIDLGDAICHSAAFGPGVIYQSNSTAITTTSVVTTSTLAAPNQYVVQRGDSLRDIAKRFGTHWDDIVALNPSIQPPDYKIYPGQVLRLK